MIKHLRLENIGPAPSLEVEEFGPRLNLFTGDNGLGKTFLLDACWYALTRTWADGKQFYPMPQSPKKPSPKIAYTIIGKNEKGAINAAEFHYRDQSWVRKQARPAMTGLVIYARIDGGFSVKDPARNYWRDDEKVGGRERPPAYQFTKDEVWDGLEEGEGKQKNIICNGLLRDVESWRTRGNGSFALLSGVLEGLSAGETETLKFGEGVRVRLDDVRDIPTLKMPYGQEVPVTQAAAGMRRVLALAYLLVWAWEEHVRAAQLQKDAPTRRIVLLFDEVEAHLHPKWQRVFLPSLLKVVDGLLVKGQVEAITGDATKHPDKIAAALEKKIPRSVQIVATTHAPLVLASAETVWKESDDKLFDFNLDADRQVHLEEVPFAKRGSAVNWLTSESFDMTTAYSVTAELAMERADAFMRQHPDSSHAPADEKESVHASLKAALGGDDEYWPYWLPYYEQAKT